MLSLLKFWLIVIFLYFRLKKYVVEPSKVNIQELINKLQKLVDDHMYLK
jgi:hypothetical protein